MLNISKIQPKSSTYGEIGIAMTLSPYRWKFEEAFSIPNLFYCMLSSWVQILALQFASCMAWGKPVNIFEFPFPYLHLENNNSSHRLLWETHVNHLGHCLSTNFVSNLSAQAMSRDHRLSMLDASSKHPGNYSKHRFLLSPYTDPWN